MEYLEIDVQFPPALQSLFKPSRYKVLYSGRGAGKSFNIAQALLIIGLQRPLRVLCARETMQSMKDSVHRLLSDAIDRMSLRTLYTVQQNAIIGPNGTEFFFAGLLHNVSNIKSAEGVDIVWVEEAQSVSDDSWDTLIPTIRKDGSEIWISFNPRLDTDPTYKRFVIDPPATATLMKLSWRDNPWFPDVLRVEMEDDRARNPEKYRHIWEGETRSTVLGAIYQEELLQANADGRVAKVSWDRSQPVHTFWDLGFGDSTCIIFAQAMRNGDYRIIDFLASNGKTIQWYIVQLQQRGYNYGEHWLPHDSVDMIIHKRLGGGDPSRSIEMLMRAAGLRVRIAPKFNVNPTGINAVRTLFPTLWFDQEKCAELLHSLAMYQWAPAKMNMLTGEKMPVREPLHDQHSHPADALRVLATSIRPPAKELQPQGSFIPDQLTSRDGWMA